MTVIANYQNLVEEIEIYNFRIKDLERELYALQRLLNNDHMSLDKYTSKYNEICNSIAIITAIIKDKKETKKQIEDKLNKLEGLEYKIAYKKFVEGKNLNEIADELGYSYIHIRRVASSK